MLMDKQNTTVARQRATLVRETEYLRNMMEDARIAERMITVDEQSDGFNESVEEQEVNEILATFEAAGDEDKDEEIGRILAATSDMTFDEMLGIQRSIGDDMLDAYTEGANLDYGHITDEFKSEIKPIMRNLKKSISIGDWKRAKKLHGDASSLLKKYRASFDAVDIDESVSSSVIGFIMMAFIDGLLISLTTFITIPLFGTGGVLVEIGEGLTIIISSAQQIAKDAKNNDISPKTFNVYRNRFSHIFDQYEKALKRLGEAIDDNIRDKK